jgi:1-acyl-sn-glycerol-3-phosphate acyltransferase
VSFILGIEAPFDEESMAIFKGIKSPVIFVSNHQSSFDVVLFGSLMNTNTTMVSKKQVKYIPLIGTYSKPILYYFHLYCIDINFIIAFTTVWMIGGIFLDRNAKQKKTSYVDQVVDVIQKRNVIHQ